MKLYPGASRIFGLLICLGSVVGTSAGCRSAASRPLQPIPPPTTKPVAMLGKPALDLTRGGAGFPLDTTQPPETAQQLVDSLARAYASRLEGTPSMDIRAEGNSLDTLDQLQINLSGSTVKKGFTPEKPPKDFKGTPFLRAGRLSYIADPLHYFNYSASLSLDVADAEMSLFPGGDGKLSLMLTDCRVGTARLRVELDDLRNGVLAGAQFRKSAAFAIRGVQLRLLSRDTRSLEADVVVQAAVLLVPATFRVTGRVDIDEDFNVYFTHLNATGVDPSGSIIASVLQGKLDKINNKAAPLMRLPGNRVRVTDLKLSLDDALTVDVQFAGSRG